MSKTLKNSKRKLSDTSTLIKEPSSITDSTRSKSSSTSISSTSAMNENDEDLVSAAEALTQLTKCVTPPPAYVSAVSSPVNAQEPSIISQHPFVTKVSEVSKHPIVTNAVKYYENSKKTYARFNYAAEFVEKAALPVVNKIEVNLNNRHHAKQLKKEEAAAAAAAAAEGSSIQKNKKRKIVIGTQNKINKYTDKNHVTLETKKRIQFCLHILRLANENINTKVSSLQSKISDKEKIRKEQRESLAQAQTQTQTGVLSSPSRNEAVQQEKTEIITTVKKIIHLISNFKPSSLSTHNISSIPANISDNTTNSDDDTLELKLTIRDIILKLPSRLQQCSMPTSTSEQTNDKIFDFAKESLEMISKLTNVFNEQLQKAELWVGGEEAEEKELSVKPELNKVEKVSEKQKEPDHPLYEMVEKTDL